MYIIFVNNCLNLKLRLFEYLIKYLNIYLKLYSENLNLVNYELLVRLPQHIPRIITN